MTTEPIRSVEATIDVCSEPGGEHPPHLRMSIPWPDSQLAQHWLWCLGAYDQARQGRHVTVAIVAGMGLDVTDERPCEYGCTDPGHPARRPERARR